MFCLFIYFLFFIFFCGVHLNHLFSFLSCVLLFCLSSFCVLNKILPVSPDCSFVFDPSTFFNVSIHRLALSHVKIVYNSCYNIVLQMPLAIPPKHRTSEQKRGSSTTNRSVVVKSNTIDG